MNCNRCSGLNVQDYAYEFDSGKWIETVRCLNCGNVQDDTIALHATIPPMPTKGHGNKQVTGVRFAKRLDQHIQESLGGAA